MDAVDAYLARFAPPARARLDQLRAAIRAAAPGARETISYGMPAYGYEKPLVWFGGFRKHIGFYPGAAALAAFAGEFAAYKHAKGSVQFPIGAPLPLDLVRRVVAFAMKQGATAP